MNPGMLLVMLFPLGAGVPAAAQDGRPAPVSDRAKSLVEMPIKRALGGREDASLVVLLQGPAPVALPADLSKFRVESPIKSALEDARAAAAPVPPPDGRVRPGLVRWHADAAAAGRAAERSGKPVLVFQLLGELDDAFC